MFWWMKLNPKEILFGKLSMQLTADVKKQCWEGIIEKANKVGDGEVRTDKSVLKEMEWFDKPNEESRSS